MKKKYHILIWVTFCAIGLFLYNYWSYSCGYCTRESLVIVSWPAKILIAVNLLIAAFLPVLHFRRRKIVQKSTCNCGQPLISLWRYCPACGSPR
ncbi:MAG: hypothetical protein GW875_04870 [Deltaproteobacteria bacterium]|nr:hypothetical protein [Deltaproteobacteria bacterium]NCP01934.1 hypothetical protein [Deltaproteobacteria bacterium]